MPFTANRGELLSGEPKGFVLSERVTGYFVTATELGEQLLEVRSGDEPLHGSGDHLGDIDAAPVSLAAGGFQHSFVQFDR